jgi:hypothetical protein
MGNIRLPLRLGLVALALASSYVPAHAAVVTYSYDMEFSGARAPGGDAPWLIATFDDHNSQGSVLLTLSSAGLISGENVKELYFNLDPLLVPAQLSFNYLANSSTAPVANKISLSSNAYKADGDGKYDIKMEFPNGSGFDAGEILAYEITGISTLTAASFSFLSAPAGGHGPYYAAAHVQNTTGAGSGSSGWIAPTVPLPAAGWLLGSGLMMLAAYGKRSLRA